MPRYYRQELFTVHGKYKSQQVIDPEHAVIIIPAGAPYECVTTGEHCAQLHARDSLPRNAVKSAYGYVWNAYSVIDGKYLSYFVSAFYARLLETSAL